MHQTTDLVWDESAIRRAIRLLAAHAPRVRDSRLTAQSLRLVWDILQRRGVPTEVFQLPGTMPLLLAGRGPVLVTTFLDDPEPRAQEREHGPPSISGDIATGAGVTRMAGVLAALGVLLRSPDGPERYTVAIEADRHAGAVALAAWLERAERHLAAAVYEVTDLPVPAPAVFRAAAGLVTFDITVRVLTRTVEQLYASALPDAGHMLSEALVALKSHEAEVLVPGFYDDVAAPSDESLEELQRVAGSVARWITGNDPNESGGMTPEHLTLGVFLAPSILVRQIQLDDSRPFMPCEARARIDARIMPGQQPARVLRAIQERVTERVPAATVQPVLVRPPATGWMVAGVSLPTDALELPIAVGDSPGGLLEAAGIPALGFATVARDPEAAEERASIADIQRGTRMILDLDARLANPEPSRA